MSDLFVDNIKHQSSQGSGTITLGASGETVALASGASQTMAVNTPAFFVNITGNSTVSDQANTKIPFTNEVVDTDNAFDNSTNYRFTIPTGKAGKYLFFFTAQVSSATASQARELQIRLQKNGSNIYHSSDKPYINDATRVTMSGSIIHDCSAGDYFELYAQMDTGSGNVSIEAYTSATSFGGYKLIGA